MHQERFKALGSFEDDSYNGMLKDSSEFLTETGNIGNRNEDILFSNSRPVSGFIIGVGDFFSESLIMQSG